MQRKINLIDFPKKKKKSIPENEFCSGLIRVFVIVISRVIFFSWSLGLRWIICVKYSLKSELVWIVTVYFRMLTRHLCAAGNIWVICVCIIAFVPYHYLEPSFNELCVMCEVDYHRCINIGFIQNNYICESRIGYDRLFFLT